MTDVPATPGPGSPPGPPEPPLDSTAALLVRIRSGDASARELLFARYLPLLRRFAHGRLPAWARGLSETDDIVQMTLVRALKHVDTFELRREGAFLAYLRHVLLNLIREEIRRSRRRPSGTDDAHRVADEGPSLIEQAVGRDMMDRYEAALAELGEEQREAVILRLEFGYSFPEIAAALGKNTASAARMMVMRALIDVAERVGREG